MYRFLILLLFLLTNLQLGYTSQYYYSELIQYDSSLFESTEQLLDGYELDDALKEVIQVLDNKSLTFEEICYANILQSKCYRLMFKQGNSLKFLNSFEEQYLEKFDTTSFIYCLYLDEKAEVFYRDKQYGISQAIHENSLQIKLKLLGENHPEIGITYRQLGDVFYYGYYDYKTAEDYFDKAFRICSKPTFKDSYLKSKAYYNIAAIYYTKKELFKAKELLLSARQIQEQSNVIDFNYLANIYSFLATLTSYDKKDTTAIDLIETAYKIRLNSNYINIKRFNQSIYIMALTYFDYKKNNKAIAFINEHLELLKNAEINDENKRQIALLNMELARNSAVIGKKDIALRLLDENFDKLDIYFRSFLSERALYFNKFAKVYFSIGKTNKAIEILEHSIEFINTEEAENSKSANIESMLFKNLGRFYASKANSNIGDLKTAIEYLAISDSLLIANKMATPWQSSKVEIAEAKNDLYNIAIENCFKYFEATKDSFGVKSAYDFIESTKAFTLLESLNQSLLLKMDGLDETKKNELKEAKQNLFYLEKKLQRDSSYEVSTQLENARISLNKFHKEIESNLVESNTEMFFNSKIPLNEFQKKIQPNQLFIVYFQTDSIFYRLKIERSNVDYETFESKDLIASTIQEFANYSPKISSSIDVKDLESRLHLLYNLLVGKIDSKINSLVIVPDGILNNFPFNSLIAEQSDSNQKANFQDLNYLLKEKTINYAYSTNFLLKSNTTINDLKTKNSFGVFNFNDELINSKEEIKYLNKILPKFSYNKNLSKWHIIDEIKNKDILHFSLHGNYDEDLKNVSLLLDDSSKIYGYEIGSIQLQSKLAFLNSCDGNIGNYVTGEGVFSMARYFMHAGCPSIVASIWKIPNQVSSEISNDFYRNLQHKNSTSVSISNAQLQYLNNKNIDDFLKHPYYWAGLIPIGIDQYIDVKKPIDFRLIVSISILLLLSIAAIGYYHSLR